MDLSSLEGPPTLDDRFTFTVSSPSPVSPVGGATWERRRLPSIPQTIPQTPISPLSDNNSSRSFSPSAASLPSTLRRARHRRGSQGGSDGGYSSYYYTASNYYNNNNNNNYYNNDRNRSVYESPTATRLRSSRSFSTLQEPASIPQRSRSADNHHHSSSSASRPSSRLITNGRLVWLDEQQIWVLVDTPFPSSQQQGAAPGTRDLPQARNPDTVHVAQHSSNPLIQYYDPITHQDEILQGGAMPPPSYESHRFSMGRLQPQRITIPPPQQRQQQQQHYHHSDRHSRGARTQWASVAERLGRSPLA